MNAHQGHAECSKQRCSEQPSGESTSARASGSRARRRKGRSMSRSRRHAEVNDGLNPHLAAAVGRRKPSSQWPMRSDSATSNEPSATARHLRVRIFGLTSNTRLIKRTRRTRDTTRREAPHREARSIFIALFLCCTLTASAAAAGGRPRYGGTLRVGIVGLPQTAEATLP